jgi:hypothetical protein
MYNTHIPIMNNYSEYIENKNRYLALKATIQRGGSGNTTKILVQYDFKYEQQDYYFDKHVDTETYIKKIKAEVKKRINDKEFIANLNVSKVFKLYFVIFAKIELDAGQVNEDLKVKIENATIEDQYVIDGVLYVQFYLQKEFDSLLFELNQDVGVKSVGIYMTIYKNGDSYIFGLAKPLKHIYQVIQHQYHNRINIDKIISTVGVNELTAEKLDYHQYFIDRDIIPKEMTKIVKNGVSPEYVSNPLSELKDNNVIKYPYHSTSRCVFMPKGSYHIKRSEHNECFVDHGYIVQKYNPTLEEVEFKSHVINGEVYYIMTRYKKDKYKCVHNFKTKHEIVGNIVNQHKDEIREVIKQAFDAMNRLRFIKEKRLKHETNRLYRLVRKLVEPYTEQIGDVSFLDKYDCHVRDKKLNILYQKSFLPSHIVDFLKLFRDGKYKCSFEAMYTSLLTNYKLDRLNALKKALNQDDVDTDQNNSDINQNVVVLIDKLIHLYSMSDYEFDQKHLKDVDHPIKDFYMRIDIALPDGVNYHKCYVNEIEPLASGKGEYKALQKCIDGYNLKGSQTSNILINMFKSCVDKNLLEYDYAKINIK